MRKFTLSVFAVCGALGLTACSSGGSGNDAKTHAGEGKAAITQTQNAGKPQNTGKPQNATTPPNTSYTPNQSAKSNTLNKSGRATTPTKPTAPNVSPPSGSYVGNAVATHNLAASDAVVHLLGSNSMDSIVVEGKNISLNLPGQEGNGFTHTFHSTAEHTGVGKQLKYLRFGYDINYLLAPRGKLPAYSFVIGSQTPVADMPAGGVANYEGYALIRPIGNGENAGFIESFSSFNVDFGNKTLNGRLDYNGNEADNILLSGSINGASFSGTRNSIKTQGYFYGPQAAELGGTFSGPINYNGAASNAIGAFGAAKK